MYMEKLIKEVENHPVLWNKCLSDYKDRNKKCIGWFNVANAVTEGLESKTDIEQKVIVQEIISKWRTVRDNYVRSQKKRKALAKSSTLSRSITPYIYEKQLAFLKRCRLPRPLVSEIKTEAYQRPNVEFDRLAEVEQTQEEVVSSGNQNHSNFPSPMILDSQNHSNCISSTSTSNQNHSICSTSTTMPGNQSNYLQLKRPNGNSNYPPSKKMKLIEDSKKGNKDQVSATESDNEDMAFYKSTMPILRTLTMDQKMEFRINLMQQLQSIKRSS